MTTTLPPTYDEASVRAAIARCGARFVEDPHGPQAEFERLPQPAEGCLALLADWGIVSATGADRIAFLQGQTTNDIAGQSPGEVRLNGYCTPKGRLLAGGPLWHDAEALLFAVSRPLAAALRKRLAMYVLRAKTVIGDESDASAILGLTGEPAGAALRELGIEPPAPMQVVRNDESGFMALGFRPTEQTGPRWWLVVPDAALAAAWASLAARLSPVSSSWWRAGEILAGEPRIVPATSEMFVPQSVNWELAGGVSFRKGCYPGQEIVARMHYRGKPKRRGFVARLAAGPAPAPGSDLLSGEAAEPAGSVIASAALPDGAIVLLHEASIEAALRGDLRTPDGRPLVHLPLPYPVPELAGGDPIANRPGPAE